MGVYFVEHKMEIRSFVVSLDVKYSSKLDIFRSFVAIFAIKK
jgi:hypothetical protein